MFVTFDLPPGTCVAPCFPSPGVWTLFGFFLFVCCWVSVSCAFWLVLFKKKNNNVS